MRLARAARIGGGLLALAALGWAAALAAVSTPAVEARLRDRLSRALVERFPGATVGERVGGLALPPAGGPRPRSAARRPAGPRRRVAPRGRVDPGAPLRARRAGRDRAPRRPARGPPRARSARRGPLALAPGGGRARRGHRAARPRRPRGVGRLARRGRLAGPPPRRARAGGPAGAPARRGGAGRARRGAPRDLRRGAARPLPRRGARRPARPRRVPRGRAHRARAGGPAARGGVRPRLVGPPGPARRAAGRRRLAPRRRAPRARGRAPRRGGPPLLALGERRGGGLPRPRRRAASAALALPPAAPRPPGSLDARLDLAGPLATPAAWTVAARLDLARLREAARRAPSPLRAPFVHRPDPADPARALVVGPASPDFVPIAELPEHVLRAVTTSEDAGFFGHDGFDFDELRNALAEGAEAGRVVRGGSTITQQLAKNLFLSPGADARAQGARGDRRRRPRGRRCRSGGSSRST